MIIVDEFKVIVDVMTNGDGGDSANRTGLYKTFKPESAFNMKLFVNKSGACVRHPAKVPWNNPKNFSRDQLIPTVTGLYFQKEYGLIRKIFLKHMFRFFFCQNFERDVIGSTKYPWPHTFINDAGIKETRYFDFADPLNIDDIWLMIYCGRIYPLWILAPIGYLWFAISLVLFCKFDKKQDEGQILCKCKVFGDLAIKYYRKYRANWAMKLFTYWEKDRDQGEIYVLLSSYIRGVK